MKKMKYTVLTTILILILGCTKVFTQQNDPVDWKFKSKNLESNKAELIFDAVINDDWHLYSMYFDEGGPIRLSINFEESDKFTVDGKTIEKSKPIFEFDSLFGINVGMYSEEAKLIQKIKIKSAEDFKIKGSLEYQVCHEGKCVLFTPDFEFNVNGVEQAVSVEPENKPKEDNKTDKSDKKELPKLNFNKISADTENEEKESETEVIKTDTNKTKETVNQAELKTSPTDGNDKLSITSKNNKTEKKSDESESLIGFFLLALAAGVFGALTPCVFPMIPMTVTFFMNASKKRSQAILMAIIFGGSIVLLYTLIGVLVSVIGKGADLPAFISTNWVINIIFFILFVVFGASFLGMFELTLPSWMATKADQQVDRGGLVAAFFMALTTVIVSFSCTGPIVGALLIEATTGAIIKPTLGMFGFGLTFALPFTLFALFPGWLKNMPKSGGWLNAVKVVLGFIVLAFSLKFFVNADTTMHWGILSRDLFVAIWIVLFALLGFYLLGKIKLPHDSDLPHISVPRLGLAIVVLSFAVYLIPGLFGAPLKAVSAFLPHESTHTFNLPMMIESNKGMISSENTSVNQLCDEPKYADFLHSPHHSIKGYFDYQQALECAKKQNKPLFIDYTGHGCANCKKMEADVLSNPEVVKRLKNDFIVVSLFVDERKELHESEWVTSKIDGKVKKTIGQINSDFRMEKFGINSQPYYFILGTDEVPLTEPKEYDLNVQNFIDFLDKGKAEFNERF